MNFMVDLETLGNTPSPCIVQIGVVGFDRHGIKKQASWDIDLKEHDAQNGEINTDTVLWWLQQSDAARAIFQKQPRIYLYQALLELGIFLGDKPILWGNGAASDCVWLREAYRRFSMRPTWTIREERCFRTLKNIFSDVPPPANVGVAHDALSDALQQTQWLLDIVAKHPEIQL